VPSGLRIDDGPVPWDSPAIRLYTNTSDLIAGQNDVNALNLSKGTANLFGIEVANTSGTPLPPPCACQKSGTFLTPNKQPGAPSTARFRHTLTQMTGDWTFTVRSAATMQQTGSATINQPSRSPVVFYALTGETLGAIYSQYGTWRFLLVNPSNGSVVDWDSRVPEATNPIVFGFSPNGDVFMCYDTTGDNSSSATFFDLVAEREETIAFTSPPVGPQNARVYLFTPCGELVARVPNQPNTLVEFATIRGAGLPFGTLVVPTVNGLDARIEVQGVGVSPLRVLSRGDVGAPGSNTGIEIVGPFDVTIVSTGISVSSNTNPRRARIDYRCLQRLPKVEVQVQPSATINVNKAAADAYAYVDLPSSTPQLARCLQTWRAPSNVVPGSPGAHFCAIAEAFTEAPINGVSVPRTTAPSFAGLVVSEENIAQQNLVIARASVATAVLAIRNPLPIAVKSALCLVPVADYAQRFRNWPKAKVEAKRSGIRLFGTDTPPKDKLHVELGAGEERLLEAIVEIATGAPEPSALAFQLTQTVLGVEAGGVALIITHGDVDLVPAARKEGRPRPCPVDASAPLRLLGSPSDPAPGTAEALHTRLTGQRAGTFFTAAKNLRDVEIYVESTSHPAIDVEGVRIGVGNIMAGSKFFASWACAVVGVPAGRHALLIVVKAVGYTPRRFILDFEVRADLPWEEDRPWFEKTFGAAALDIAKG
jgi:hypothetical protein